MAKYIMGKKTSLDVCEDADTYLTNISVKLTHGIFEKVYASLLKVANELATKVKADVGVQLATQSMDEVKFDARVKIASETTDKVALKVMAKLLDEIAANVAEEVVAMIATHVADKIPDSKVFQTTRILADLVENTVVNEVMNTVAKAANVLATFVVNEVVRAQDGITDDDANTITATVAADDAHDFVVTETTMVANNVAAIVPATLARLMGSAT